MVEIIISGKWNGYTGQAELASTPLIKPEYTQAQVDAFTALCKVLPVGDRKKIWDEINNSGCKIPVDGQVLRESLIGKPRRGLRWQ